MHLEHAGIHTIHLCDAVERTAAEYEIRHLCIIDAVIDQETDAVAFLRPESGQADDTAVIRRRRLKLYVAASVHHEFTVRQ